MSGRIVTAGQLRQWLVDMMVGVKNGDLKLDEASRITKMAAQVNESFYSEIKIARVQKELGRVPVELGNLPINGGQEIADRPAKK